MCCKSRGGKRVAGGFVTGETYSDKGYIGVDLKCTDYNFIFQRRKVANKYENMTVSDILINLISTYAPEFTVNHLQVCSTVIDELQLDNIYLSEAIKKVVQHTSDWHYYIDTNMDFHLFRGYESTGSQYSTNVLDKSFKADYNISETYNRIWIIGG